MTKLVAGYGLLLSEQRLLFHFSLQMEHTASAQLASRAFRLYTVLSLHVLLQGLGCKPADHKLQQADDINSYAGCNAMPCNEIVE